MLGGRLLPPILAMARRLPVGQALLSGALVIAFLYGWTAEYVGGVAAITGTYLAGVLIAETEFKTAIDAGIHPLTYSMFVPIFFISIGLRANARALGGHALFTIVLVAVAIAGKVAGCGMFARGSGFDRRAALRVGVGMIWRGEVG
jgi:Kef-type K+ transport system membrane component KefB